MHADARESRPILVISDVHVGAIDARRERAFHRFLRHAAEGAGGLVINGDLFDLWVPSRRFVDRRFVRTLAVLGDVVAAGLTVWFVGGNHDATEYGTDVLREDVGLEVLDDPARMTLAGRTALVTHGDGVRAIGDAYVKEHPILRAVLRSDTIARLLDRVMPSDRLHRAASRISRMPRLAAQARRGEGTGPKPYAERIERWARAELARDASLDLVLAGHSHLPALVETEPGRFYVNTGDWVEHLTYAELRPGEAPVMRRWEEE